MDIAIKTPRTVEGIVAAQETIKALTGKIGRDYTEIATSDSYRNASKDVVIYGRQDYGVSAWDRLCHFENRTDIAKWFVLDIRPLIVPKTLNVTLFTENAREAFDVEIGLRETKIKNRVFTNHSIMLLADQIKRHEANAKR